MSERLGDDGRAGAAVIVLKALGPDDWRAWRSLRRRALADAPDAFGSTLSEWSGARDTETRWRHRLDTVAHNLLAELDGRAVGMASATAPEEGDVTLLSMWVAPEGRGRGVGDALVASVKEWARRSGGARVQLDVRVTSTHAVALYARHGFVDVGAASEPGDPRPERRMVVVLDVPEAPHDVARS